MFGSYDQPIPEKLETNEFVFRPLRATDVKLDFLAVVESRAQLRELFQGAWPSDDFTLADNLSDLEIHEKEHEQRRAYTFTIMDPGEATCLGCIYFTPLAHYLKDLDDARASEATNGDAAICFWVRSSRLADGLEERVLRHLVDWLKEKWRFRHALLTARESATRQAALFETAGLEEIFRLPHPIEGSGFVFFA